MEASSSRCREPGLVLLDMQSVPAGQEGWLAFDVTTAANRWLLHPRSNMGIRLYVETDEGGRLTLKPGAADCFLCSDRVLCPLAQTGPCPQAGSGWWVAEGLAPNSPSW